MKKILLSILLVFQTIYANNNINKFSIEIGAGPTYTFYGIKLCYDYENMGGSFLISPQNLLNNYAGYFHYNFYLCNGSLIIGPELSIGHRDGEEPIYKSHFIATYSGLSANFQGYISNNLYLKNQYGIEYEINNNYSGLGPHFGIGLGYNFMGGKNNEKWYFDNKLFNALGFGFGTIAIIGISIPILALLSLD